MGKFIESSAIESWERVKNENKMVRIQRRVRWINTIFLWINQYLIQTNGLLIRPIRFEWAIVRWIWRRITIRKDWLQRPSYWKKNQKVLKNKSRNAPLSGRARLSRKNGVICPLVIRLSYNARLPFVPNLRPTKQNKTMWIFLQVPEQTRSDCKN